MPSVKLPPAVLRLPNPKGDLDNFVSAYTAVQATFGTDSDFDIDEGVATLIERRMLSSSGAVGGEALRRSTRPDRSRDPLFNQFKMFSELYRLLGWLHTTSSKARFKCTLLGKYVASYPGEIQRQLVEESLLGITLPSEHSENLGVINCRPFARLLRLMALVGGDISRDEMILGLYTIEDDLEPSILDRRAKMIKTLRSRGEYSEIQRLLKVAADRRQVNTLQNYTRFMIGSIRRIGWTIEDRRFNVYDCSVKFDRLTPKGADVAAALETRLDLRQPQLSAAPVESRASLCVAAHFGILARAGVPLAVEHHRAAGDAMAVAASQIALVKEWHFDDLQYSPYQQADRDALRAAEA